MNQLRVLAEPCATLKISVIIPALNEERLISRAIGSAFESGANEVIVSDGGSEDDTREVAEQAGASVVLGPRGRGPQQNRGADFASGDTLVFLHADSRLGSRCLEQIRELASGSALPVYGAFRHRIDASATIYRWIEKGNALRVRVQGMPYGDQAIFVSKSMFDELGGFENLEIMEDYFSPFALAGCSTRFYYPVRCKRAQGDGRRTVSFDKQLGIPCWRQQRELGSIPTI